MKKTLLLLSIIAVLFISLETASAAVAGSVIEPQSTSCTISFSKTSSTSAQAKVLATRPGASSITSTIQLQKKSGSSYVNVGSPAVKTVKSNSINHIKTFSISASNTYRIRVTIKYTKKGVTTSNNYYKNLQ